MISRSVLVLILLMLLAICVPANAADTNSGGKLWFPVGEQMIYRLYWGIVPVGDASISTAWVEEDGRKLVSLKMRAKTGKVVSKLYPVDDVIESIVDPETFLPIRYTQKLKEGKKVRNETSVFDHANGVLHWTSHLDGSTTNIAIAADTRDVLSLIFYMRSQGFGMKDEKKLRVLVDDQLYDLLVRGLKYEQTYLAKFGYIECLKVEPKAKFGEIFVRKGKVWMWFSNDKRRVCTKIAAKVPVAKVKAILRSVKSPDKDFWTSGKKRKKRRR